MTECIWPYIHEKRREEVGVSFVEGGSFWRLWVGSNEVVVVVVVRCCRTSLYTVRCLYRPRHLLVEWKSKIMGKSRSDLLVAH